MNAVTLEKKIQKLETDFRAVEAARDQQLAEIAVAVRKRFETDWLPELDVTINTRQVVVSIPGATSAFGSMDIGYTAEPMSLNTYSTKADSNPEYQRLRLAGILAEQIQNGSFAEWLMPQIREVHARYTQAIEAAGLKQLPELRKQLQQISVNAMQDRMKKMLQPGMEIRFRKPTTIQKRWDEAYNQVEQISVTELRGKRVVIQIQKRHGADVRIQNIQVPILLDRFTEQMQQWIQTEQIA